MPNQPPDIVRDRRLERFKLLSANMSAEQALADREGEWFVVVDETKALLGAVTRTALRRLEGDAPVKDALPGSPTVVADARTPVGLLLASPAIRSSYPGAVIVRTETDVIGIWSEEELLQQALESTRGTGDWSLPGDIAIPLVLRCCRFKDGEKSCTFVKPFKEKPIDPFECANPERLKSHHFTW